MPPYITFPQLNFRFNIGNINDLSNLDANVDAFSFALMPRGREPLLSYITSFGVTNATNQNNTANWTNGFAQLPYVASPINNNAYFTTTNQVNVIQGDGQGTSDLQDWVIFNFGPTGNDFSGRGDNSDRYFGGEGGNLRSGGRGLGGTSVISTITSATVTTGQIYGFGSAGWRLLYQLPLDNTTGFNHSNVNWWNTGTTVNAGNGKRVEYDTYQITHVGFGVI